MFDRPSFWHRAADPDGLLAALSAAGLLGDCRRRPDQPGRPTLAGRGGRGDGPRLRDILPRAWWWRG